MFKSIKMKTIKSTYTCPIELTMDIIGGKWKLRILFFLNDSTKRFSEIECIKGSPFNKIEYLVLLEWAWSYTGFF